MSDELKPLLPCPFCGEVPFLEKVHHDTWEINCRYGSCWFTPSTGYMQDKNSCIAAWNTRATVQRVPVKVKLPKIYQAGNTGTHANVVRIDELLPALEAVGIAVEIDNPSAPRQINTTQMSSDITEDLAS